MEVIIGILTFTTIAFATGFIWQTRWRHRMAMLVDDRWKVRRKTEGYWDTVTTEWQFQAPDEGKWREFSEAVKRQKLLDQRKRYNLPSDDAPRATESGTWK